VRAVAAALAAAAAALLEIDEALLLLPLSERC
jgi:hypothetical protein